MNTETTNQRVKSDPNAFINNILDTMVSELLKNGMQQRTTESSTMECKKEKEDTCEMEKENKCETESSFSEYQQDWKTFNKLLDSHFVLLETFREMNKST